LNAVLDPWMELTATAALTFLTGLSLLGLALWARVRRLTRREGVIKLDVKCGQSTAEIHRYCRPACRPSWTKALAYWEDDQALVFEVLSLSRHPRYRIKRSKFRDPDCRARGCSATAEGEPCGPLDAVLPFVRQESDRGLINLRTNDAEAFRQWAGLPNLDAEEASV
jgi:hypothetical protein